MTHTDITRNPNKRGRPRSLARSSMMGRDGTTRNQLDMMAAAFRNMAPDLTEELLQAVGRKETTLTVMGYVGRFPPDQQREAYRVLNTLGSRAAKRWVECITRPPTPADVTRRLLGWLAKEFPGVDEGVIAAGLAAAAAELERET